jgi:hypothetical protein
MKKYTKLIIVLACAILFSTTIYAQNPGDPGNGDDPDASIPLDEGLLTVLISGAAIGISRLTKKKKSN